MTQKEIDTLFMHMSDKYRATGSSPSASPITLYSMQADYGQGHGWESECVGSLEEMLKQIAEYRSNAPQYSYRVQQHTTQARRK